MRLIPIFDTSVLINLCREDDVNAAVKRLKPFIPSRGCPLSFVTTLELFRGLAKGDPNKIASTLKPLLLGALISRRKVLRAPLTFASWELFHLPDALNHQPRLLVQWLEKIQAPDFASQFVSGRVEMNFDFIRQQSAKVEQEESRDTKAMLDRWNPDWREDRRSGSALPTHLREAAKRGMQFGILRGPMPAHFLTSLGVETTPINIAKADLHCDAFFTFQINRMRASVIGNYDFERNSNDFHDWLQLLYLTRPGFCFVTDDGPSLERTLQSAQRPRIMSLGEFLLTAA
jgi:hypothetical protein